MKACFLLLHYLMTWQPPVLVALALGLALLFRPQAMQSFGAVDWMQLRPASQTFKGKPA